MSALCRVECVMSNVDRYGTFFLVTPDLIRGPWARRRWDGSRIKSGMTKKANVRSPRPRGWLSSGDGDSRRLAVQSIHAHRAARLDLGGLRFDEPHAMADHVGVLNLVVGAARQIDHILAFAAAGAPGVGFARFAGAVSAPAQHPQRT